MKFKYGMKLRGFSIACQPMNGLISVTDDLTGRYYNILTYDRRLEVREIEDYELVFVGMED